MSDEQDTIEVEATKKSYTISCTSSFRDRVLALAEKRRVTPSDLARSILTLLPEEKIEVTKDPGDPPAQDREIVVLKSGPAKGRVLKRKPRLQVRLNDGYAEKTIRKALAFALSLDHGQLSLEITASQAAPVEEKKPVTSMNTTALQKIRTLMDENERMRALIHALAFEPLPDGPKTPEEALYILGMPPRQRFDKKLLKSKFRMLAMIYHPDGVMGDHRRMSQLNAALDAIDKM